MYFTSKVKLIFAEKRKPKISGFKNVMDRGIRNILTFVIRYIILNFWHYKTEALVILKRLKLP